MKQIQKYMCLLACLLFLQILCIEASIDMSNKNGRNKQKDPIVHARPAQGSTPELSSNRRVQISDGLE
jgi:hypothetical protein